MPFLHFHHFIARVHSNCHDMSLLSGIICAHAVGAKYPFEKYKEAKKDFNRLRDLMGI